MVESIYPDGQRRFPNRTIDETSASSPHHRRAREEGADLLGSGMSSWRRRGPLEETSRHTYRPWVSRRCPGHPRLRRGGAQQDVPVSKVRSFQPLTEVASATLKSFSTTSSRGSM